MTYNLFEQLHSLLIYITVFSSFIYVFISYHYTRIHLFSYLPICIHIFIYLPPEFNLPPATFYLFYEIICDIK